MIDEADRMIEEVKHDWLDLVEKSINQNKEYHFKDGHLNENKETDSLKPEEGNETKKRKLYDVVTSSKVLSKTLIYDHFGVLHPAPKHPPQKLLFSATLSHNPEKLHVLRLHQPKLFTSAVGGDVGEGGYGDSGKKKSSVRNGDESKVGGDDDDIGGGDDDVETDNDEDDDNAGNSNNDDMSDHDGEKKGAKRKREEKEVETVAKKKLELSMSWTISTFLI